ncbi:hypothetical protein ABES25_16850 [Bacillus gobiensis]
MKLSKGLESVLRDSKADLAMYRIEAGGSFLLNNPNLNAKTPQFQRATEK